MPKGRPPGAKNKPKVPDDVLPKVSDTRLRLASRMSLGANTHYANRSPRKGEGPQAPKISQR